MIEQIVSGGQTGVDRAALDVAIKMSVTYGGWCPKGRLDELGVIPSNYDKLIEISGEFESDKQNYDTRTKLNIRDSDGTLIIVPSMPLPLKIKDGTLLTISEVSSQKKPFLLLDLSSSEDDNISSVVEWVKMNDIRILNIAGPRESNSNGIYQKSFLFLSNMVERLESTHSYTI